MVNVTFETNKFIQSNWAEIYYWIIIIKTFFHEIAWKVPFVISQNCRREDSWLAHPPHSWAWCTRLSSSSAPCTWLLWVLLWSTSSWLSPLVTAHFSPTPSGVTENPTQFQDLKLHIQATYKSWRLFLHNICKIQPSLFIHTAKTLSLITATSLTLAWQMQSCLIHIHSKYSCKDHFPSPSLWYNREGGASGGIQREGWWSNISCL